MTEKDLLGDDVPAHLKQRGKHYVAPKGYAAPPGTGPTGHTCGDCRHIVRSYSGRFRKCGLNKLKWTSGPRTDVLARSPACKKWEKKDDELPAAPQAD